MKLGWSVAAVVCTLLMAGAAFGAPVHFVVDVPWCTPRASTVLLRSNRLDVAIFEEDMLVETAPTRWEGTFEIAIDPSLLRYKYSHAPCDAQSCIGIEKALEFTGSDADVSDRTLTATQTETSDLVLIWRDALTTFDGAGQVTGTRTEAEQVAFCAPYLSISGPDEITIGYDSYYGDDVSLEYGPTSSYGTTLAHQGQYRNHFALSGLVPGQTYHYRIIEDGFVGPDQQFVAPKDAGQPFRFAMLGDTQFYVEQQRIDHRRFTEIIRAFDPHLVLSVGDMVASEPGLGGPGGWMYPEMARWNVFFGVASSHLATAPFLAAMGNHEEDAPFFWDAFAFPVSDPPALDHYTFRYGHVQFIALYTGTTDGYDTQGILDSQTNWMQQTLTAAAADPSVRFKIVFLHRGHYSDGNRHDDGGQFYEGGSGNRPAWRQLWQTQGVDLVLGGHNHNFTFARADGIHFYTACSGAPVHELRATRRPTTIHAEERCTANLFTVGPNTITIEPRRADGTRIEEASASLCHQDSDCVELDAGCPGSTTWACTNNTCRATCEPVMDAGGQDLGAGDIGLTDDASTPDGEADVDLGLPDVNFDSGPRDASGRDAGPVDAGVPPRGERCSCRAPKAPERSGLDLMLSLLLCSWGASRAHRRRSRRWPLSDTSP